MKINLAITDDHNMVIKGIQAMLEDENEINIVATYNSGREMLQNLAKDNPHLLLLDINLPDGNGIELCGEIVKNYPGIRIIALSNYNDSAFIKNMMRNGAQGYLLKNTEKNELISAIKFVYRGEKYIPVNIKEILLNDSLGSGQSTRFVPKLSRRENEILKLVYDEHTNQEIADKLFISIKTVESHRQNLLQKLNVRNTAGLIKIAINKGLI